VGIVQGLLRTRRLRAVAPRAYLVDALQRMGMRPQSRCFVEPGDPAAVAEAREAWQHDDSSRERDAPAFVRRQRLDARPNLPVSPVRPLFRGGARWQSDPCA
jgi:hypothetical protein